jgi:hypothetical protein
LINRTDRGLTAAVLLICLLLAPAIGLAQDIPTKSWLSTLETAVNKMDVAVLRANTAPGVEPGFQWATMPPGMMGPKLPWKVKWLEVPDSGRAYVAFTKYHPCESSSDHLYRTVRTEDGHRLGEEIPETETLGTRVRHHQLTVRFDVPSQQSFITDRVSLEMQSHREQQCILRINEIYKVTSVSSEGKAIPYRQAGGFLWLPTPPGRVATFDLAYHGGIKGGAEDYIRANQAALTSYWYPHTGRLPATCEVKVTVPKGWIGIAQGEPIGKSVTPQAVTTSWKNDLPVCYFTVAAGKYTVTTRKVGNVSVSAYLLRPSTARAREAISSAGSAIQWFSKNLSKYPYSRYAVVETDVFPAALECYSFTLAGRSLIPMAIVHEVAHTWWGGVVPNTYTRTLWNESFAEYSDGLYTRLSGGSGMHEFNTQMMGSGLMDMLGVPEVSLMEANDAMNMSHSIIGYGKGSLVLENLERMLGTQKMLACMRHFIARHMPGEDAEWRDFIDAVEETAGKEWRHFFPAWLNRTDQPALRLSDVKSSREGDKFVVTGTVVQNEPAFWIQVPVVVQTRAGQTRREVTVKSTSQPFRIELTNKPSEVLLDPGRETLRASSKGAAQPTLLSFVTASDPVLAVYATGGTDRERAAAKAVASEQAKEVMPFAKIGVKADADVTLADLAGANVLLIGRPESLTLPAGWREMLPLTYSEQGVAMGTRHWKGADVWGLAVFPHPTRKKGLVAHVAGVSPEALRNFRHQQNLDSLKGLFVVKGAGKAVLQEPSRANDATVVVLQP